MPKTGSSLSRPAERNRSAGLLPRSLRRRIDRGEFGAVQFLLALPSRPALGFPRCRAIRKRRERHGDRRTTSRSSRRLIITIRNTDLSAAIKDIRRRSSLRLGRCVKQGGEGNEREFRTDPFQVNNPGDWADEKRRIAGLRKGQPMTPAVSADAALRWLRYKSEIRQNGKIVGYSDDQEALRGYNGRNDFSRQSGAVPHKTWYARTIIDMATRATVTPK